MTLLQQVQRSRHRCTLVRPHSVTSYRTVAPCYTTSMLVLRHGVVWDSIVDWFHQNCRLEWMHVVSLRTIDISKLPVCGRYAMIRDISFMVPCVSFPGVRLNRQPVSVTSLQCLLTAPDPSTVPSGNAGLLARRAPGVRRSYSDQHVSRHPTHKSCVGAPKLSNIIKRFHLPSRRA